MSAEPSLKYWILSLLFIIPSMTHGGQPNSAFAVVLDPGHGGEDHGVKKDGLTEKTIALELAKEVAQLLSTRSDIQVVVTRGGDTNPSFDDRRGVANRYMNGIFMSLHFAGAPSEKKSGGRIYVLPKVREASTKDLVPIETAHLPRLRETERAAQYFQKALRPLCGNVVIVKAHRPMAPILGVTIPALFIEIDHLTSKEGEKWNDHQTILSAAEVLSRAIDDYIARSP